MDSKTAKKIKSKGSKIERMLAQAMWKRGLRYRKNDLMVYGKPDFVFKTKQIAIFCDSEFWHGYNYVVKGEGFKTNAPFWEKKILRNIQRDREVDAKLSADGWHVLRFWGKQIKNELENCVDTVVKVYTREKENEKAI